MSLFLAHLINVIKSRMPPIVSQDAEFVLDRSKEPRRTRIELKPLANPSRETVVSIYEGVFRNYFKPYQNIERA